MIKAVSFGVVCVNIDHDKICISSYIELVFIIYEVPIYIYIMNLSNEPSLDCNSDPLPRLSPPKISLHRPLLYIIGMGGWYCWILSTPAFPIPEDCVGWKIVPQSLPNISHHQQIRSLSPVLDFKHLMKIYSWTWNYSAFSASTFVPDQINVNLHWQFWAL